MDEFVPCSVCSRTPLIGEEVTVLGRGGGESPVCSLCLERPRTRALGEPLRQERMRSATGAANVRRSWPVPAPRIERRETTPVC
jgi:hypothetical protein